jgi:glutaredoxin-related protein
VSLNLANWAFK